MLQPSMWLHQGCHIVGFLYNREIFVCTFRIKFVPFVNCKMKCHQESCGEGTCKNFVVCVGDSCSKAHGCDPEFHII
jgi:hypothetical protein